MTRTEDIAGWFLVDGNMSKAGVKEELKQVGGDISFLTSVARNLRDAKSKYIFIRAVNLLRNKQTFLESVLNNK